MTNNDEGRPDGNGTASTRNLNDATRITDSGDGFSFADWVAGRPDAGRSAIDDWIDKPRPHSLVRRLTDRGHGDLLRQPANSDSDDAAIVAQFDRFFNGGKPAERPAITPAPIDTTDRDRAYAAATLAEVAREVAATPEGARNHTLNAKALRSTATPPTLRWACYRTRASSPKPMWRPGRVPKPGRSALVPPTPLDHWVTPTPS